MEKVELLEEAAALEAGEDAPVPLWKIYMDKALEDQPALGFTQVGLGVTPSAAPPSATGPEG